MVYRALMPISHSGQKILAGQLVSDHEKYGERAKSLLPIARLLERGRIVEVSTPVSEPPAPEPAPELPPAPEPAAAPEPQPSKRKVVAL